MDSDLKILFWNPPFKFNKMGDLRDLALNYDLDYS